ncbi:MAG: NTP transferase domain-containing protein [Actinomycetota bacterium]
MSNRSISGLVLATGTGATMRSARPTPIHLLCGRAMGSYVLDTLAAVEVRQGVVVTGPEGGRISKRLLEDPPGFRVRFVEQKIDRGSGDAVLAGLAGFDDFNDDEDLVIVPGDLPLLRPELVEELLRHHAESGSVCTVLAVDGTDVTGGNRVVRDRQGRVSGVQREGDPRPDPDGDIELNPEVATGVYCVRRGLLAPAIRRSSADTLGEMQLHAMVEVLASSGHSCSSYVVEPTLDLVPVGNRLQLAEAEAELRRRTNRHWLASGVTMVDPDRTYIDATVTLGTDVTIFPGTILQGSTVVGNGCELGPDVRLDRCEVGSNTRIEKATATLATIGDDCEIGPFAVLAPGSDVNSGTRTGPFYAEGTGT